MANEQEVDNLEEDVDVESVINQVTDEETQKKIQTLDSQRMRWRDKEKKSAEALQQQEEQNKILKEQLAKFEKPEQVEPSDKEKTILDARTYARLLNQNYSEEEIDSIETMMKATGKPLPEVIEMPFVKGGVESLRAQKKVEQATPSPSNTAPAVNWAEASKLKPHERAEKLSFAAWQGRRG